MTSLPKEKNGIEKHDPFPIVGIGASAGGLEALEQLLEKIPDNCGMAFVVIQHLDPTQKGMLPELLQRITKMKVFQAKDSMVVQPGCVYVIPPNKSMSILKGVLYLFTPIEVRGMRLPIDFFFRSLADDQKEFAVGVILSGMGSDGSIGIGAIKENNGIVLVQDPDTAKFDSMPRNAINTGFVDVVVPSQKIYLKLTEVLEHLPIVKSELNAGIESNTALDKIIILLRTHTGNDFSLYKKNTINRRIERRMSVHKIEQINSYIRFLQKNPKEIHILFKELLIGVTSFFRDPMVWERIKETVIPAKVGKHQSGSTLRAWIPGCSTGEEAYSLAIIFREIVEKINPHGGFSLQIFATDLDNEAIETARKGVFPVNITADVSPIRLSRFFTKTDEGYRIDTEIRETIVFAQHNILMHPPFTNIDFISCRNLLIYLDSELQEKLLGLFYYSLNPTGFLLLGNSETLGSQSHLFSTESSSLKIYKRDNSNLAPELFDFPSSFSRTKHINYDNKVPDKPILNIQNLADELLLQQFAPASVLVNENGDILYFSGQTGKYLEPAVGKANLNIFAMLRPGFQSEFAIAFRRVTMQKETAELHNVKIITNGNSITLNVTMQWIHKPEGLFGKLLIIFREVFNTVDNKSPSKRGKQTLVNIREKELEEQLKICQKEVQSIMEEMQTSQEELKSTNEELQSTNEELQSTNEELTTSKEEMQSLNEELQTVNAELQSKVDDYSRINNDMKNLLNSTDIATLFLDKELNIRRYTDQATKIFKLIKSDIGRQLTDLVSQLIYPQMVEDAYEVLRTLRFVEKQIPTKDGRWLSTRIMPYRTLDDKIDGLVITFINISNLKETDDKLKETNQLNNLLLQFTSDVIIKLSPDWRILEFNTGAEDLFGIKRIDSINQSFIDLLVPAPMKRQTEQQMNQLMNQEGIAKIKTHAIVAGGAKREIEWTFDVVFNNLNSPTKIIIITKQK